MVIGKSEGRIYEITRKRDAQILYVKDISDYYNMRQQYLVRNCDWFVATR